MKQTTLTQERNFENLTIHPKLLARIHELGYVTPTPIQHQCIPHAIEGKDLLGIAQTGTGKTLAFAVPLIQRLAEVKGRGLVLVPTRELALQVEEVFRTIGMSVGLKTAVVIGGAPIGPQTKILKTNPHVIIATPGRLIDHIERKGVHLDRISVLVLDEADLMFDMGFAPQIARILKEVPRTRQTLLFSATMPKAIEALAAVNMDHPVRVEASRIGSSPQQIVQEVRYAERGDRVEVIDQILKANEGSAIIFVRTKFTAKKLCFALRGLRYAATEIHSNRSLAQRRDALDGFKKGKNRILVATDIAARGIDVSGIGFVINYDLPENPEDYEHRIGCTGRAGRPGHAISLASKGQSQLIRRIEQFTGSRLPVEGSQFKGSGNPQYTLSDDRQSRPTHGRAPASATRKSTRTNYTPRKTAYAAGGGVKRSAGVRYFAKKKSARW